MGAREQKQRRIQSFLALGEEEKKAAEILLGLLPRQAAFFQQQAAEKLVRALLEVEDLVAGPTHNLRTLIDLLPRDHAMREDLLRLEDLSSAATRFRYPSGSGGAPDISIAIVQDRHERLTAVQQKAMAFVAMKMKAGS